MKRLDSEELLGVFEDVRNEYSIAKQMRGCAETLKTYCSSNILPRLVLLQEAMRFYMFAAYQVAGVDQEIDSHLYDLLADSTELAAHFGLGLVKLEGLACVDVNTIEAATITESDLDYFEEGLSESAGRFLDVFEDLMRESGVDNANDYMSKLRKLL